LTADHLPGPVIPHRIISVQARHPRARSTDLKTSKATSRRRKDEVDRRHDDKEAKGCASAASVLAFAITTVRINIDFSPVAIVAAILVFASRLLDLSFAFAGDAGYGEYEENRKDQPRQPSVLFIAGHWTPPSSGSQ
jgi:hypothetical protein